MTTHQIHTDIASNMIANLKSVILNDLAFAKTEGMTEEAVAAIYESIEFKMEFLQDFWGLSREEAYKQIFN